jgi:uroporphyrinogen decarboxylase
MTPKERVNRALAHQEPDMVPIGEFAIDYPMFEAVLGRPTWWRGHFKTQKALWEGRRDEVVESQIADAIEFFHKTDQDLISVNLVPSKNHPVEPWKQLDSETYEDPKGDKYRISPKSEWLWCIERKDPWPEYSVDDFPMPETFGEPDDSSWELVRAIVKEFGDTHFICARSGDGTFPLMGGMERGLVLMHEQPEVVQAAAEADMARTIHMDRLWAREGADGLCPGTDYADTRGPLVSPQLIEDRFFPLMRKHCEAAHAVGLPVLKHACGNNWRLMDMLIDAGYDAYQAIQETASMDLGRLKKEYGSKITLWGGVNTETLLAGTPDEIREEVRRAVRLAGPGGGLILGTSHSVLVGARYDNYMAMLDEARRVGSYPIEV